MPDYIQTMSKVAEECFTRFFEHIANPIHNHHNEDADTAYYFIPPRVEKSVIDLRERIERAKHQKQQEIKRIKKELNRLKAIEYVDIALFRGTQMTKSERRQMERLQGRLDVLLSTAVSHGRETRQKRVAHLPDIVMSNDFIRNIGAWFESAPEEWRMLICARYLSQGAPPSYDDLAAQFGYKSKGVIAQKFQLIAVSVCSYLRIDIDHPMDKITFGRRCYA